MKVFSDLKFYCESIFGGIVAKMMFENKFGISVIRNKHSYGNGEGLYEIALLNAIGNLTHRQDITGDEVVVGYLDENGVTQYMEKIQILNDSGLYAKSVSTDSIIPIEVKE
jgi:hypothetical protein